MKILFAASDNNLTSGAFRSMAVLNRILNQKHNIETIVALPNDGDGQTLLDKYGVKHTRIDSTGWIVKNNKKMSNEEIEQMEINAKRNLVSINKFVNLIKKEKIDIVHVNTSYNYVAAMAAHICNKPVVWHLREFLEEDQQRRFYDKTFSLSLIAKSSKVVCISNALEKKYQPYIEKNKLVVIHNGIDTKDFYNPDKKIFKKKKTIFLCAGSVNYNKGQDCLIEACGKLKKSGYQNFEVWLPGTINEKYTKIITDLAKKYNIENKVKILGRRNDVDKLMRMADISFMCSRFEAFGRVTVEAMMSGLLLIAANTGGTLEIVKDKKTGILYEQGNSDDLCKKIIYALRHKKEMMKIAKKGREDVFCNMSADRNANEVAKLYKTTLDTFNYKDNGVMAVVVTYNRLNALKKCITAILNQTYSNLKILVVDNASTDGTDKYLFSLKNNRVIYCNTGKNIGGAGGFNYGMKIAYYLGYKWIWIMDDDVVPNRSALSELVTASKISKGKKAYFASCVYNLKGEAMNTPGIDLKNKNGYPFWYQYLDAGMVRLNASTFVSLLINSDAITKCGLPYKDFFIWGDDTEYTKRLYRYYGSAYLVGKSKVIHLREDSDNLSILKETNPARIKLFYYFIRNTLVYTNEYVGYGPFKDKLNLFHSYYATLKKSKDPLKKEKMSVIKKGIKGFYSFNFAKFKDRFDICVEDSIKYSKTREANQSIVEFYKNYRNEHGTKKAIKRFLYGTYYKSFRWRFFETVTWLPRYVYRLTKK